MIAATEIPFWSALLTGAALIAAAVAMLIITNRAATGALGPNRGLGIRTSDTRRSTEAWQAAHRAAKPFVQFGAMALVASGGVAIALGDEPAAFYGVLLVGVVLMLLAIGGATVVAGRAAREVTPRP